MRRILFMAFISVIFGLQSNGAWAQKTESYDDLWKKVDEFRDVGRPVSALEITTKILEKAKKEKNDPQKIKGLIHQMLFTNLKEENAFENSIIQIEQEIKLSEEPAKSILHSALAEMYWGFYQSNRWEISGRTHTNKESADMKTWTAREFVSKSVFHFDQSISKEDLLTKINPKTFDLIWDKGRNSEELQPTLYDLLAHRAINFYSNDESGVTRPVDAFELTKQEYFSETKDFVKLYFETNDTLSFSLKSMQIFQNLLRVNLKTGKEDALIYNEIIRLKYVRDKSAIKNKERLFLEALNKLMAQYPTNPVTAEVYYEKALQFQREGGNYNPLTDTTNHWKIKQAKELCETVISNYPDTYGSELCKRMLDGILLIQAQIQTEEVTMSEREFLISLEYKNMDKIHFRIVREQCAPILDAGNNYQYNVEYYLKKPSIKSWSVDLNDLQDFQSHRVDIPMNALNQGKYILIASSSDGFKTGQDLVISKEFWVSDLAYLLLSKEDGDSKICVTNRMSGRPIKGVSAKLYVEKYNYQKRSRDLIDGGIQITDDRGMIVLHSESESFNYRVFLTYKEDSLMISNPVYVRKFQQRSPRKNLRTAIFTDRAIYRPGQVVYFKGLLMEKEGYEVSLVPSKAVLVKLMDVNNQEVARLDINTNEFGSFQGSFVLPSSGLTGSYQIDDGITRVSISVEEYKRPQFLIIPEKISENVRLNDEVEIKGKVESFNKVPLVGATGRYRIVRKTVMPFYWMRMGYIPQATSAEISSGSFSCDKEGNFSIKFTALPDLSVPEDRNPVFHFDVELIATDANGESQMGKFSVPVGYESLTLSMEMGEDIDKNTETAFQISSSNLQGEFTETNIKVEIFQLMSPEKALRSKLWNEADQFIIGQDEFKKRFSDDPYRAEDLMKNWPLGKMVFQTEFENKEGNKLKIDQLKSWKSGAYIVKLSAVDPFGQTVDWEKRVTIFGFNDKTLPVPANLWVTPLSDENFVSETAEILVGSTIKKTQILYSIRNKEGLRKEEWLSLDGEFQKISIPISEEDRGNVSIDFQMVCLGRLYTYSHTINVPYDNKELKIELKTFRETLMPGSKEKWNLKITSKKGTPEVGELMVSMYDQSLDEFRKHKWHFNPYDYYHSRFYWNSGSNFFIGSGNIYSIRNNEISPLRDRQFDKLNWFGFSVLHGFYGGSNRNFSRSQSLNNYNEAEGMADQNETPTIEKSAKIEADENKESVPDKVEIQDKINPILRSDFRETAFFYPSLKTTSDGISEFEFTVPDALTKWKFQAFAHTKDLKYGLQELHVVSQKELMIVPNYPRFLSVADTMNFTARISNLSDSKLKGVATIEIKQGDPMVLNQDLVSSEHEQEFELEAGGSTAVSWKIHAPNTAGLVEITARASTENHEDGELRIIPVISNKILITESYPINLRPGEEHTTQVKNVRESFSDKEIDVLAYTVEACPNPSWYVIQALPYLSEGGNESCDQIFNRFYSNSLAYSILNSSPSIKAVFEAWKRNPEQSLSSMLERNPELKNSVLQETPWVLEAKSDAENKARLANFFDDNNIQNSLKSALFELVQSQSPNGGWPWFKGMEDNRYITQNIVTGLAKLDRLGIKMIRQDQQLWTSIQLAVDYMDKRINDDYRQILAKSNKNDYRLNATQIQYLYARGLIKDIPIPESSQEAVNYFYQQAEKHWLVQGRYLQAMIALALNREDNKNVAQKIMVSLKEKSISHQEFGMYWKREAGYYWHQQGVEEQAMLIEAFDEVMSDEIAVEEMKIWLLKQKQTQIWKTNKATVEACYALLARGENLLEKEGEISVVTGPYNLESDKIKKELGTGYFKKTWDEHEITQDMDRIHFENQGESVSYASVYFQYFQDGEKVESSANALSLIREIYIKTNTSQGPQLKLVENDVFVKTGDIIVSRLVLKSDRDLEFVHLKDLRAAGCEPIHVISGMNYQSGTGYYQSVKDMSTELYFDRLNKGTYVFEFEQKAGNPGSFSSGIANVQSFYAPQFSAHSKGVRIHIH